MANGFLKRQIKPVQCFQKLIHTFARIKIKYIFILNEHRARNEFNCSELVLMSERAREIENARSLNETSVISSLTCFVLRITPPHLVLLLTSMQYTDVTWRTWFPIRNSIRRRIITNARKKWITRNTGSYMISNLRYKWERKRERDEACRYYWWWWKQNQMNPEYF